MSAYDYDLVVIGSGPGGQGAAIAVAAQASGERIPAAVVACGGTVDCLVATVFDHPTLSEAYEVAALDAMNSTRELGRFRVVAGEA